MSVNESVHAPLSWLSGRRASGVGDTTTATPWVIGVVCLGGGVGCGAALTTGEDGTARLLSIAFAVVAALGAAAAVRAVPDGHPRAATERCLRATGVSGIVVLATSGVVSLSGAERPSWQGLGAALGTTWAALQLVAVRGRQSRSSPCIVAAESWPQAAELARRLEASGYEVAELRVVTGTVPLEDELGVVGETDVVVPTQLVGRGIEQLLLRHGGGRLFLALPRDGAGTGDAPPGAALIRVHPGAQPLPPACRAAKRAVDLVVATGALVVCAPVIAVAAIAIRFDSPGGWLFSQERVGLAGRRFRLLKLRTMLLDNDDREHREYVASMISSTAPRMAGVYKLVDDTRCTRVGRVLRRWSVDELPQLWNVIRGDMSLVGPRPCLPGEVAIHPDGALARLGVGPGITGPWQVSGRSRLSFDQMIELDVEYARRWSLLWDLRILARTPVALWQRETA